MSENNVNHLASKRTPGRKLHRPLWMKTLADDRRIGELDMFSDDVSTMFTILSVAFFGILNLFQTSTSISPSWLRWMTRAIWRARKTIVKKAKVIKSLGDSFLVPQRPEKATKKTTPPIAMRITLRKLMVVTWIRISSSLGRSLRPS